MFNFISSILYNYAYPWNIGLQNVNVPYFQIIIELQNTIILYLFMICLIIFIYNTTWVYDNKLCLDFPNILRTNSIKNNFTLLSSTNINATTNDVSEIRDGMGDLLEGENTSSSILNNDDHNLSEGISEATSNNNLAGPWNTTSGVTPSSNSTGSSNTSSVGASQSTSTPGVSSSTNPGNAPYSNFNTSSNDQSDTFQESFPNYPYGDNTPSPNVVASTTEMPVMTQSPDLDNVVSLVDIYHQLHAIVRRFYPNLRLSVHETFAILEQLGINQAMDSNTLNTIFNTLNNRPALTSVLRTIIPNYRLWVGPWSFMNNIFGTNFPANNVYAIFYDLGTGGLAYAGLLRTYNRYVFNMPLSRHINLARTRIIFERQARRHRAFFVLVTAPTLVVYLRGRNPFRDTPNTITNNASMSFILFSAFPKTFFAFWVMILLLSLYLYSTIGFYYYKIFLLVLLYTPIFGYVICLVVLQKYISLRKNGLEVRNVSNAYPKFISDELDFIWEMSISPETIIDCKRFYYRCIVAYLGVIALSGIMLNIPNPFTNWFAI